MRLRKAVMALGLAALVLPTVAAGQGRGRVTRVPSRKAVGQQQISVTDFTPKAGPAGTRVTITGNGFAQQTKVVIGGRPTKVESFNPTTIVFVVPARPGDGTIVLRHPGAANDVLVGTFALAADALITRIAPEAGAAGTRVEILGSGFQAGDQLLFNSKQLPIAELSAGRLVTTIPAGATTDHFYVLRPSTGKQARAPRPFTVTMPSPAITGFAPTSGPPGTQVRVSGANFAPGDDVYFGHIRLVIQNRGEGWLDVIIPGNARTNEVLSIRGPRGGSTTASPFVVILPPSVRRFEPRWGAAGTQVEIHGDNFLRGDEIRFNGRPLRILTVEDARLVVEIPAGARTDTFLLFRGGTQQAAANHPFEVVMPPVVTGFSPAGGPDGTRVTIAGSGFGQDAHVIYGAAQLRIQARTESSIEVVVPPGATSQPFIVRTRGGEAKSAQTFQVYIYSAISSVTPASGPIGTRVWIRGRNFNPTDVFYLNGLTLAIVERQPEGYQVVIPPGATSGPIAWDSYGHRQTSQFRFEVLQPPQLGSFTPTSGPVGTQVTITGVNLDAATAVFYGSLPCTVVRRALPTQIVAVIPPGAVGTDYLWVETAGQRARSAHSFQVITPPLISGFAPASGQSGTQVTVRGANFTADSVVLLGNLRMPVVRKDLPTQIIVTVPVDARGADYLWVEDRGQRVKSAQMFGVVVPHVVSSVAPLSGPVGTQVTILGERFTSAARVWFGNLACPIINRAGGTTIIVSIPAGASGSAALVVEDGAMRVPSSQAFQVVEAAPTWPDGVPHEHAHEHPHPVGDHHHHPHAHPHRPGTNHHHPL